MNGLIMVVDANFCISEGAKESSRINQLTELQGLSQVGSPFA